MATESAERAARQAEAAAWEDTRDERERLADERERLSDERERLADERERLADQDERIADRMSADPDGTGDGAQEQLVRADARVQRALAGTGTCGRQSDRTSLRQERIDAPRPSAPLPPRARTRSGTTRSTRTRRSGRGSVGASSPPNANVSPTSGSRRPTFATSWPGCANRRPTSVTGPRAGGEELALRRIADVTGLAAGRDQPTDRARHDLAAVREAGRRQRVAATDTRRQAAVDRADAGRRRMAAGSMRLPYGGYLAAQFAALHAGAVRLPGPVRGRASGSATSCSSASRASSRAGSPSSRACARWRTWPPTTSPSSSTPISWRGKRVPSASRSTAASPSRSVTWPVTCGGRRSGPWPPSSASPGSRPVASPCVATRTGTRSVH